MLVLMSIGFGNYCILHNVCAHILESAGSSKQKKRDPRPGCVPETEVYSFLK